MISANISQYRIIIKIISIVIVVSILLFQSIVFAYFPEHAKTFLRLPLDTKQTNKRIHDSQEKINGEPKIPKREFIKQIGKIIITASLPFGLKGNGHSSKDKKSVYAFTQTFFSCMGELAVNLIPELDIRKSHPKIEMEIQAKDGLLLPEKVLVICAGPDLIRDSKTMNIEKDGKLTIANYFSKDLANTETFIGFLIRFPDSKRRKINIKWLRIEGVDIREVGNFRTDMGLTKIAVGAIGTNL